MELSPPLPPVVSQVPCVYVPGITVLLSLTVFMLLVAEIMPATSDSVPLIGKRARGSTERHGHRGCPGFPSTGMEHSCPLATESCTAPWICHEEVTCWLTWAHARGRASPALGFGYKTPPSSLILPHMLVIEPEMSPLEMHHFSLSHWFAKSFVKWNGTHLHA